MGLVVVDPVAEDAEKMAEKALLIVAVLCWAVAVKGQ